MVSQAIKYIGLVLPGAVLWLLAILQVLPGFHELSPTLRQQLWLTPVYAVVLLGIYAVTSVLVGVATFNDCPDAYHELKQEIEDAKKDLQSKGIKS